MIRDIIITAPTEAALLSALDAAGLTTSRVEDGVRFTALSGLGWNCTPPAVVSAPTGKTIKANGEDVPEYKALPGVYATLRLSGADVDVSAITAKDPPQGVPGFGPLPAPKPVTDAHIAWIEQALLELGKLDHVEAAVAANPAMRSLWRRVTTLNINDPEVVALSQAFGIDRRALFDRADEIRISRRA